VEFGGRGDKGSSVWCVSFPHQTVLLFPPLSFAFAEPTLISGACSTSVKQVCWVPTLGPWEKPGISVGRWLRQNDDAAANSCESTQIGEAQCLELPSQSTFLCEKPTKRGQSEPHQTRSSCIISFAPLCGRSDCRPRLRPPEVLHCGNQGVKESKAVYCADEQKEPQVDETATGRQTGRQDPQTSAPTAASRGSWPGGRPRSYPP